MAGNINKVILIGTLGSVPEGRGTQVGDFVVSFDLATSESWRDRTSGERHERTELHRIVIFDQQPAAIAFRYLRQGSKIYIEGRVQTRQWRDQQGQQCRTPEIVLSQNRGALLMLDGRRLGAMKPSSVRQA